MVLVRAWLPLSTSMPLIIWMRLLNTLRARMCPCPIQKCWSEPPCPKRVMSSRRSRRLYLLLSSGGSWRRLDEKSTDAQNVRYHGRGQDSPLAEKRGCPHQKKRHPATG